MKSLFSKLKNSNTGAGIVTVLVAVFLVVALGSALLYISYVGFMVKTSERKSEVNFYSAETAMDELRAGLQEAVTESVALAYTDVLANYSDIITAYNSAPQSIQLSDYIEKEFATKFKIRISEWSYMHEGSIIKLFHDDFLSGGTNEKFYVEALQKFLSDPPGTLTLTCGGATFGSCTLTYEKIEDTDVNVLKSIVLKNIAVNYENEGYKTSISTDIVLNVPPFSYNPNEYSVTNLNRVSLVAGGTLTHGAGSTNVSVTGDTYAHDVLFDSPGTSVTFTDATFICADSFAVDNVQTFDLTGAATLWAGNIDVGGYARLNLNGTINVADDLTFSGTRASVVLGGDGIGDQYNGFGFQKNELDNAVPGSSSSIVVNGRENSLDMSRLESLTLAGTSFISADAAENLAMGQSVATRSDQLAYLVPADCLPEGYPSNPCLNTSGVKVNETTASQEIMNKIHALSLKSGRGYYSKVSGVSILYPNVSSVGENKLIYFFMTFATVDDANDFFAGYFSENSSQIETYLKSYLSELKSAQNVFTRGESYLSSNGTKITLGEAAPANSLSMMTKPYRESFVNLCTTLSPTTASNAADPYAFLVNTAAVEALPLETQFKNGDDTLGRIINGNYTIEADETAKVIIATGNVTVNADYNGLIIAKGDIELSGMCGSINSSADVSAALQAVHGTQTLLDFMNIGSGTGASSTAQGLTWDVDKLVTYGNWKKF